MCNVPLGFNLMTYSLQFVFLLNFTGGHALSGMFEVGLCSDTNLTIKS